MVNIFHRNIVTFLNFKYTSSNQKRYWRFLAPTPFFLRPGCLHFFLYDRVVHFRGNEVTDGIDCDEYDNYNAIRCKYGCRGD